MLTEILSSSNSYHPYASETNVPLRADGFLELAPCRFVAEDQDIVDRRTHGNGTFRVGDTLGLGWHSLKALHPDTILERASMTHKFCRPGIRFKIAKEFGVLHIGARSYSLGMVRNVYRACCTVSSSFPRIQRLSRVPLSVPTDY